MWVSLYRCGLKYGQANRNKRGQFRKNFNSIEELCKYLTTARTVYPVDLSSDLSSEEYKLFLNKYRAIHMDGKLLKNNAGARYARKRRKKEMRKYPPNSFMRILLYQEDLE